YLFDATTFELRHTLLNPHPDDPILSFGFSSVVAGVGANALVGAHERSYLFDGTSGVLLQEFSKGSSDPNSSARLSGVGNSVFVGDPRDDTAGPDAGAVFLFDATTGEHLHTFLSPNPGEDGDFGFSVAAVGDRVLIGARREEVAGRPYAGAAYLFDISTGELLHSFPNSFTDGEQFGWSVAARDNRVLVGAPYDDNGGAAHLFATTSDTTTDVNGDYSFSGLDPGDYEISELVAEGYRQTRPFGDGIHRVTIVGDEHLTDLDFANVLNDPPVAEDDAYSVDVNTALSVGAGLGVLANDTDLDGDPLTAVLEAEPSYGILELEPDGSFTYTPQLDFSGEDTFTYRADDGDLRSNLATVTIAVAPFAVDVSLAVVSSPSAADVAQQPPTSLEAAAFGSTYYVEAWIRGVDGNPAGIIGGRLDLLYDTALCDVTAVGHGGLYGALPSGTIHESDGRVEDLGGGTFADGQAVSDWVRLGYVELTAAEPGETDFWLDPGSLHLAHALGGGNISWDLVDLSDTVRVVHQGAVDLDVSVVLDPTATESNGEVAALPESEPYLHEWQSYWVELWVSTPALDTSGVIGGTVDLGYNTDYFTATGIEYGPAFTEDQGGTIDDSLGLIDDLGATTTLADVGDDQYALLARVRFEPTTADQVPVDEAGHVIGPYDLGLALSDAQLTLTEVGPATARFGDPPGTELWAVVYDIDDNDQIDFGDFSYFAGAFAQPVDGNEPPWKWWADFDKAPSAQVDFGDFTFFAGNFSKSKAGGEAITFAGNYPATWSLPEQPEEPGEEPPPSGINDDAYTGYEDSPLWVEPADGVLANDSGPGGASLEASLDSVSEHGTVQLNADGSFAYQPDADFVGTDTFTYKAIPGSGVQDVVTGLENPSLIALDTVNGKVYWHEWVQAGSSKWQSVIRRANLDGSGDEIIVEVEVENSVRALAVDVSGGKVYWSVSFWTGGTAIFRANLDGSAAEGLIDLPGVWQVRSLAVDEINGKLYWGDIDGGVHRADLDGTGVEDIVTLPHEASSLALDIPRGKMYWSDNHVDKIQRANLDGTSIEDLVTDLVQLTALTVDPAAGKVYWTDVGTNGVEDTVLRSADLDGSNVEMLSIPSDAVPVGLALDAANQQLYWTDAAADKIQRMSLVPGIEDVMTGLSSPYNLAVDSVHGKMYWRGPPQQDPGTGTWTYNILRADLDGTNMEVVVPDIERFEGFTLDPVGGKIYWAQYSWDAANPAVIRRADLDGSNVETIFADASMGPEFLAVDSVGGKIYWGTSGAGGGLYRANLDGSEVELLFDATSYHNTYPVNVELDVAAGKVYWRLRNETDKQDIWRANLDGSEPEVVLADTRVVYVVLDPANEKMYLHDSGEPGVDDTLLKRANLDGSEMEVILPWEGRAPIALDSPAGMIYWTERGASNIDTGKIRRMPTEGPEGQTATVTVTVVPDDPDFLAADDAYLVSEDATLSVDGADGVLANDSDGAGGSFGAQLIDDPAHGSAAVGPDGSFTYTPTAHFSGIDQFSYKAVKPESVEHLVSQHADPVDLALDLVNAKIYWTDGWDIKRSDLDGGNVQSWFRTSDPYNYRIAVDPVGGYVYWADNGWNIRRIHIQTKVPEMVVSGANAKDMAIDPAAGKIYWTSPVPDDGRIRRADLDGANAETLIAGLEEPNRIALDLVNGKIYWTDSCADKIQRADLDGSNVEDLITVGLVGPGDIAVDPAEGRIYWAEKHYRKIQSADLDGKNARDVATSLATIPNGLELEASAGKVYWSGKSYTEGIFRADTHPPTDSNVATVTLTVEPVNDAPTANADEYTASEDNKLTVAAGAGVLSHDDDVEDDPLTAVLADGPEHGSVVLEPDGSFVYIPEAAYVGPDSFTYFANDGTDDSSLAAVDLTVREIWVDVGLSVVGTPTAGDTAAALPDSIESIDAGETYYAEIWVQDKSDTGAGISGGTVDVQYTTAIADAIGLDHGGIFTVLTSGTIDDAAGLVDDFGGGSFLDDQGIEPNWARLGLIEFSAADAGSVSFSLGQGSLQFGLYPSVGNVDWSLVDLSDVVTVYQRGGSRVDMTAVTTPTTTDANGEVDALPDNETRIHEWEDYWAELWVSTPAHVSQGISSATMDLAYDTAYYTATEIEYGPAFTDGQSGSIDDATGLVNDVGAATALTDIGDDRPALLARVHFEPTAADQVPMDEVNNFGGPYDPGLSLSDIQVSRVDVGLTIDEVGPLPATELYAVPYDVNDDDVIDSDDYAVFAAAFAVPVGGAEPPYATWADFDVSRLVDFNDFGFFAANYLRAKPDAGILPASGVAISPTAASAAAEPPRGGAPEGEGPEPKLATALVARLAPSGSDTAAVLPESLAGVALGGTFVVELWVQDVSASTPGVTGGYIDVRYTTDTLDPAGGLNHGGVFNVFANGALDDGVGLVDDFGGATLSGGVGVQPNWARLGYAEFAVTDAGRMAFQLEPGAFEFSLFDAGNVLWEEVGLSELALKLVPAAVVDRHIFYNNSVFDGNDLAIAT
ncbi:MAG: Ig-like domain-containing protein, partial [Planctomycetota bacterium]